MLPLLHPVEYSHRRDDTAVLPCSGRSAQKNHPSVVKIGAESGSVVQDKREEEVAWTAVQPDDRWEIL